MSRLTRAPATNTEQKTCDEEREISTSRASCCSVPPRCVSAMTMQWRKLQTPLYAAVKQIIDMCQYSWYEIHEKFIAFQNDPITICSDVLKMQFISSRIRQNTCVSLSFNRNPPQGIVAMRINFRGPIITDEDFRFHFVCSRVSSRVEFLQVDFVRNQASKPANFFFFLSIHHDKQRRRSASVVRWESENRIV